MRRKFRCYFRFFCASIPLQQGVIMCMWFINYDLLVSDHTQSSCWSWKNTSWATVPPTTLLTDKAWHCKILKQRGIYVCLAWFGSVTLHWGILRKNNTIVDTLDEECWGAILGNCSEATKEGESKRVWLVEHPHKQKINKDVWLVEL